MTILEPAIIAEHKIEPGWRYGLQFLPRWSDLDGYGHVSHRAHFVWFEEVRNGYLAQMGFPIANAEVPGPVIKETTCNYERVLALGEHVVVTGRTKWFGTTSFLMEYAIWNRGLVARGQAVIVWVLNSTGSKIPLPAPLCQGLIADGAVPRSPQPPR
nr:thioesterase family protein [uncultured Duganella sp.]